MPANWQIGDRIQNRWEIHKILRGGMGVVYVVYDHEWHEPFAAKTFQDEIFSRAPGIANRFTQEALTWVNLDAHQNVTRARFVKTIAGKPYLFLEYVSGGDLGGWVGTPRLTEDLPQVLRFAIEFCEGMRCCGDGAVPQRPLPVMTSTSPSTRTMTKRGSIRGPDCTR